MPNIHVPYPDYMIEDENQTIKVNPEYHVKYDVGLDTNFNLQEEIDEAYRNQLLKQQGFEVVAKAPHPQESEPGYFYAPHIPQMSNTFKVSDNVTTSTNMWWVDPSEDGDCDNCDRTVDCDDDYLSVGEFKDFMYDLIESKGGALPDLDDWKEIKAMLDLLVDDREYDVIDEDEEAMYKMPGFDETIERMADEFRDQIDDEVFGQLLKEKRWNQEKYQSWADLYTVQWTAETKTPTLSNDLQSSSSNNVSITLSNV